MVKNKTLYVKSYFKNIENKFKIFQVPKQTFVLQKIIIVFENNHQRGPKPVSSSDLPCAFHMSLPVKLLACAKEGNKLSYVIITAVNLS